MRRTLGWTILVWGCALPLLMVMWTREEPDGQFGIICGVALWTIALVAYGERLRSQSRVRTSRILRSGAAAFLVVQGLVAAMLPPLAFFLLYSPAVWVAGRSRLIPSDASSFHGNLVLTTICGAQAFACAFGLGRLVESVRPAVERMLAGARQRLGR